MRQYITLIIILLLSLGVKAQDYIIESVEHLPTDMTARQHIKKDFKDRDCAVLRFATQGIAPEKRAGFYFQPDLGSDVVEKSLQSGEIWVWVSPNIKVLRVKHDELGSYELHFTKYLPDAVQELHTYKVLLKAVVPPPPPVMQYNYMIVKADQPNAVITIDGQFAGEGEASKSFKVGETHTWSIECELYHPESGNATIVKDNAVTVEKTLRPAFGYINVTSTPESGANVFIDNKFAGTTPFKTDRIASGEHKVRVMKEMYSTAEKTVTVTDGNTTQAAVALSANFVNVTVSTDSGSDIYIDNEPKGKGRWTGRLSDGGHAFEARKASHKSAFLSATFTLGRDEDIVIPNPEPIYGTLDVNSSPMGATIVIDGRNCGTTPKVLYDVLIGSHELRLEKSGCATVTKTITLDEKNLLAVNEKLQTGREISISTDRQGDQLYADGNYLGASPLTATLSFGSHNLKAVRDSKSVEKTVTVAQTGGDSSVRLAFKQEINGHEYVDLGLPSGTLWATCNVGASKPEDYGNYYAWGETAKKRRYNWRTYKWCNGSYNTLTKYNTDSYYGTVDNKKVLDPEDDAAHVNWGGAWRMPTYDEIRELVDNCTWTWTTQGGKNGYRVTGLNGKSIFLPAAGCYYGGSRNYAGSDGYYWSGSLLSLPDYAYRLDFDSGGVDMDDSYRGCGPSVRPVCPSQK